MYLSVYYVLCVNMYTSHTQDVVHDVLLVVYLCTCVCIVWSALLAFQSLVNNARPEYQTNEYCSESIGMCVNFSAN